jgi:hypothetical protein
MHPSPGQLLETRHVPAPGNSQDAAALQLIIRRFGKGTLWNFTDFAIVSFIILPPLLGIVVSSFRHCRNENEFLTF